MIKSLRSKNHRLSSSAEQLEVLNGNIFQSGDLPTFQQKLEESGLQGLRPSKLAILQLNLGYRCNQTCKHCHVDAGPDRKEVMTKEIMEYSLDFAIKNKISTLDLTGGAPEMNPHFIWLINEAVNRGISEIIVRSNLTILVANKKYRELPEFFSKNKIRIVSSLPFYKPEKTDRQRGEGVFQKSIEALKILNKHGYGHSSDLIIDLVYNPSGAFLPADQKSLENEFKKELRENYGIEFNNLLNITNLPISRYLDYLLQTDNFEEYLDALIEAYNPSTLMSVMCTNTLSVGWDGALYDCDFNQMLELKSAVDQPHISQINEPDLQKRNIVVSQHCYGCTAGSGSSCQGNLI